MLERNRLQPPRPTPRGPAAAQTPALPAAGAAGASGWLDAEASRIGGLFTSADDFDATGILSGVDPCESRYWWMPELFDAPATDAVDRAAPAGIPAAGPVAGQFAVQATRRTGSRSTAAA